MGNNILSLGSVVILKEGDGTELMVITRGALVEQNGQVAYFDYGSVTIPQGMSTPDQVYFFNRENVEQVIFEGYVNEEEKVFASQYDENISNCGFPKAKI